MANQKLSRLIERRAELQARKSEANDVLSGITAEITDVEYAIKAIMIDAEIDSTKTAAGTVSIKDDIAPAIDDFGAFVTWCSETGNSGMIQKRVSSTRFKEYFSNTGELPEGLELNQFKKLNFRSAR